MTETVAIIGAGMAGIACARALADAGITPVVFDKGRGIGGRMATRRAGDGLQFDHGAQYVTARDARFATVLAGLEATGGAARWGRDGRHVGLPGMSGLVRALATGLDIRQAVQVAAVEPERGGWRLHWPGGAGRFDRVVIAVPAPQAAALLPEGHDMAAAIATARYDPCLTLMAAFPEGSAAPFEAATDDGSALSWIAQDSSKPGRGGAGHVAWVAQAGPAWSRANLELSPEAAALRMLPLLAARIGADMAQSVHVSAHRWRYARVARALEVPFLRDTGGRLHAGGDWCLGARVEAAWISGTEIAADILRTA